MQQHIIQIFMWAWYPESAKIHQKVSGGFWRIQDMSNIYTGGFWWIQDTSILCVTKLVDFGGFRILSSKNTKGVRVNAYRKSDKYGHNMMKAFLYSNGRSFRLARQKLIIESYFTNYSKTITHQAEIFQGKLSTIVIFTPCKLPMLSRGFKKHLDKYKCLWNSYKSNLLVRLASEQKSKYRISCCKMLTNLKDLKCNK